MTERLLAPLERLYTAGDLEGLRRTLLHSSAWCQHQFTAYGDELVSRCWMAWLAPCGLSRAESVERVQASGESLLVLTLRPERGDEAVRVGLWAWHDDEHIKRVLCQIDTEALCRSLRIEGAQLAGRLPEPDPLVVGDYDPLRHPHLGDVTPGDLLDAAPGIREPLQGWWELWQRMQLANVARYYAADARILLPGAASVTTRAELGGYCGRWFARQHRRFCQPESVIADASDPGSIAVLWRMEGDMPAGDVLRRVRVPVVSLLRIADGAIRSDTMLVDEVTLGRQLATR